jgi:predicted Co/Zn/Cd cation transporter (cation efflux family)
MAPTCPHGAVITTPVRVALTLPVLVSIPMLDAHIALTDRLPMTPDTFSITHPDVFRAKVTDPIIVACALSVYEA